MRRWRPRWRPGKLLQGRTVRRASAAAAAPWAARARCVRFQPEACLIATHACRSVGLNGGGLLEQPRQEEDLGPAGTPEEAVKRMLDKKKLSSKINYDNLNGLFSGCAHRRLPRQLASTHSVRQLSSVRPTQERIWRRPHAQAGRGCCNGPACRQPRHAPGHSRRRRQGAGRSARRGGPHRQGRPGHAAACQRAPLTQPAALAATLLLSPLLCFGCLRLQCPVCFPGGCLLDLLAI